MTPADEYAAEIVRRIFRMKLDGKNIYQIAKTLNKERVPTPGEYKVMNGSKRKWQPLSEYVFWDASNISVILRDERYIGNCVYGKRERFEVGNANTRAQSKSRWIIVKNTHEAIISEDDFNTVQGMFRQFEKSGLPTKIKTPLTERIRCGGCYHKLQAHGRANTVLFCGTPSVCDNRNCFMGKLNAKEIEGAILLLLQTHLKTLITYGKRQATKQLKLRKPNDSRALEAAIEKLKNDRTECYELYQEDKISEDEYEEKRKVSNQAIKSLNVEIDKLKGHIGGNSELDKSKLSVIEDAKRFYGVTELTKEAVEIFIDCIYVYNNSRIEVVWSFNDIVENTQIHF